MQGDEMTSKSNVCVDAPEALQTWRFTSIFSTAMTMTAAVAHFMELPGKMKYEPPLYVRLHRTLYPTYGKTAGYAEFVAVVSTGALAWWTGKRQLRAASLTTAAAGCLAAAHAIFWALVAPANRKMSSWELDAIPAEWQRWRDQWEYSHAARAVLVTGALGALVASVLRETGGQEKTETT
jgi:hypothetical protein